MSFALTSTIVGLENKANAMERARIDQALEDSLQLIMQSTQMGFKNRVSPEGVPWAPNPQWWQDVKGQDSPNVGPSSTKVHSGELAGAYKLASINHRRMMNSLTKSKAGMVGRVEYTPSVEERAKMTQWGGRGTIEFIPIKKSSSPYDQTLVFNVEIIERPHLGIATYPRIGDKTDAQWCEYYFGQQVDIQLAADFGKQA